MTSFNLFEPIPSTTETFTPNKRHKVCSHLKLQAKKSNDDNYDDLLVFGYGCKLFRDDTLALKIETDAYLIPWNGDQNLLIDRCVLNSNKNISFFFPFFLYESNSISK
jgi:hypothetical protein